MNEVGDETLAQRAAAGDMEAFEELVNRHRSAVYRLARTLTGNHHDADDAAQETFVRVFRALGSFDPNRPFKPWLKRITYNTSLNVLRSSKVRSRQTTSENLPEIADPSPGPGCSIQAGQTMEKVDEALLNMPGELRATLLLRTVDGMSYKEIAAATGVRIGTVMSRLSRARERVHEVLEPAGRVVQRGAKG
ncbi:MAG: RNA polymerase sigma factor [bacterium]|nr:RNA polymerase sigma factor [bacterium]